MRVLFVAPYPPSRIRVRSYGFLQQLRREHQVVVSLMHVPKCSAACALLTNGKSVLAHSWAGACLGLGE